MTEDKPARLLRDLVVNEGSLVDVGANPEAHIMLFKTKRESFIEKVKRMVGLKKVDILSLRDDLYGAIDKVFEAGPEPDPDVLTSAAQMALGKFCSSAEELYPQHKSAIDELKKLAEGDIGIEQLAVAVGLVEGMCESTSEAEAPEQNNNMEEETMTKSEVVTFENVLSGLSQEQRAVVEAEISKHAKPVEVESEPKEEEIMKSLPESIRKKLERATEIEAALAKSEEDAERLAYVTKAKEFAEGANSEDLGGALYLVAKSNKDAAEKIEQAFRALTAQLAKSDSLTEAVGSEATGPSDVETRIEGLAKEIQKNNPSLTNEAAWLQVVKQNPELYAQLRS